MALRAISHRTHLLCSQCQSFLLEFPLLEAFVPLYLVMLCLVAVLGLTFANIVGIPLPLL